MEIKEILENIKKVANRETASRNALMEMKDTDYQLLLDYITNLQQENERLKEKSINEVLKNDFNMCVKDLKKANKKIEKLEDYKSRIEKAAEMINKYELIVGYYDYADEDGYWDTGKNNNLQEELKDTLNGRSDE